MGNLAFLFLIFLAACGKGLPEAQIAPLQREQVLSLNPDDLSGILEAEDGSEIVISANRVKPLVLVFASDSCAVCTAETKHFVSHLASRQANALDNTDYITVLIGAYPEDLTNWISRLSVSWTTGLQVDDELFEKFCEEKLTPCIITFNPATKKIAKFLGETSLEKLQQETGPWTYSPKELP